MHLCAARTHTVMQRDVQGTSGPNIHSPPNDKMLHNNNASIHEKHHATASQCADCGYSCPQLLLSYLQVHEQKDKQTDQDDCRNSKSSLKYLVTKTKPAEDLSESSYWVLTSCFLHKLPYKNIFTPCICSDTKWNTILLCCFREDL